MIFGQKKILLFIPVFLIRCIMPVQGQNDSVFVKKKYKTWIKSPREPKK